MTLPLAENTASRSPSRADGGAPPGSLQCPARGTAAFWRPASASRRRRTGGPTPLVRCSRASPARPAVQRCTEEHLLVGVGEADGRQQRQVEHRCLAAAKPAGAVTGGHCSAAQSRRTVPVHFPTDDIDQWRPGSSCAPLQAVADACSRAAPSGRNRAILFGRLSIAPPAQGRGACSTGSPTGQTSPSSSTGTR